MDYKSCIAWMWMALFRLIITLFVGWLLAERLLAQYRALARILSQF